MFEAIFFEIFSWYILIQNFAFRMLFHLTLFKDLSGKVCGTKINYEIYLHQLKKKLLFILWLFCIAITVSGFCNNKNSLVGADDVLSQCSVATVKYPHTELNVSYNSVNIAGSYKTHNHPNFIPGFQFTKSISLCSLRSNNEYLADFPSKRYLLHIYPSHNFW